MHTPPAPRPSRSALRTGLWTTAAGVAVVAVLGALVATGTVWPNRIPAAAYEVRGVDVSHYQGEIAWDVLATQDLDFAWIKATEGASHTDPRFAENWAAATGTDLLVGAYHFMSFESPGAEQAAHLASEVPATPGTLPPVIDLEFYGPYFDDPPTPDEVCAILDPLVAGIEEHYGVPPIVYATEEAYDRYVAGRYPDLPVWIRSVAWPPRLSDGRDWTVWQYSNRDRLAGYDGAEPYIDLNVFAGTREELAHLTLP
ncbi:GH25 family lysozyme [Promicromonospora sp. NPDC019610]|uniref:GH25 family lysozyme n=1 Tax=Promicromonospora sp. NPDC019610 TaxID=3364405 RepID=UPI0037AA253D